MTILGILVAVTLVAVTLHQSAAILLHDPKGPVMTTKVNAKNLSVPQPTSTRIARHLADRRLDNGEVVWASDGALVPVRSAR